MYHLHFSLGMQVSREIKWPSGTKRRKQDSFAEEKGAEKKKVNRPGEEMMELEQKHYAGCSGGMEELWMSGTPECWYYWEKKWKLT